MKRLIISFLVAGFCAGTATATMAQNVTAGDKPNEAAQGMTTDPNQKEMTNPSKGMDVTSPGKGKHDKSAAAFKTADKDSDGTLDKEEAKAMPHVARNFDAIDTDKDGTVSLKEVHTFMKAKHDAAKN